MTARGPTLYLFQSAMCADLSLDISQHGPVKAPPDLFKYQNLCRSLHCHLLNKTEFPASQSLAFMEGQLLVEVKFAFQSIAVFSPAYAPQ